MKAEHPSWRKRTGFYTCVVTVFAVAIATSPAAARHTSNHASHGVHDRHGKHESKHESDYTPPYAAIVLDANSGKVLHSDKPDELRHPASLTKIMTLYLLFEKLDAGKLRLDSQLPVSEHASVQAPTKLGLKPGQTIEVEDAIRGLVTKSANDAAVAVAEAIGGSEGDFAEMMTQKAHALGMSRTVYRNASGLPNDEQVTTAREQALLGRAIQERFPRYYRYFATPSFTYQGQTMRNHNHLLGQVEGMDGIKTGYTQASGFNLVASVRRSDRHIVAVVLGGTSAGARDARMRSLIEDYIGAASPHKDLIAAVAGSKADAPRKDEPRKDEPRATGTRTAAATTAPETRTRSIGTVPADPWSAPVTYSVASTSPGRQPASPAQPAATSGAATPAPAAVPASSAPESAAPPPVAATATDPIKPIHVKTIKVRMAPAQVAALAPPPGALTAAPVQEPKRGHERDLIAETIRETTPPQSAPSHTAPPATHTGWMIQVGAFDAEQEARERLSIAQAKAGDMLKHANPFTETVVSGEKTFYRARFAGIQKDQADAICRQLKRNDIACMTINIKN